MRRIKPVQVNMHPSLYSKMEEIRKYWRDKNGINLSQMDLTSLMAKKISPAKFNKIDLIGGNLLDKKKRRPY